jgi:putative thioredoxin
MSNTVHSADVTRADFEERVIRKSHEIPVVADFWAGWCAPCRMLKPVLEKLAAEYGGKFFLARIDTDAEQDVAARYGVRSLPTVKIFRDGKAVDEFMGALPESQVRAVLDRHMPRASDALIAAARQQLAQGNSAEAVATLRAAVAGDPANDRAGLELARVLLHTANLTEEAATEVRRLLAALSPENRNGPEAGRLRARLELLRLAGTGQDRAQTADGGTEEQFQSALRQVLAGDAGSGMEQLLDIVKRDRRFRDDGARKTLLTCFEMLGPRDERVRKYQLQLSRALY